MREKINYFMRRNLDKDNRSRLKKSDFSIISQNCTGGVIYHDLGLEFLSPTVNLFFAQNDFIKFCMNIEYHMKQEVKEIKTDRSYPVGMIGDIKLNFMHYQSFEDARSCWNRRKERIKFDKMIMIGVAPKETELSTVEAFEKIPYPKILLCQEEINSKSAFCVPGFDKIRSNQLLGFVSPISGKRYLDAWDYVSWINEVVND